MENSPQMYRLVKEKAGYGGKTFYNSRDGVIEFHYDSFASLGHEFKHGAQFEQRELSFAGNGSNLWGPGLLFDLSDEYSAHVRAIAYDQFHYRNIGVYNYDDITPSWIMKRDADYAKFPQMALNGNSKIGTIQLINSRELSNSIVIQMTYRDALSRGLINNEYGKK